MPIIIIWYPQKYILGLSKHTTQHEPVCGYTNFPQSVLDIAMTTASTTGHAFSELNGVAVHFSALISLDYYSPWASLSVINNIINIFRWIRSPKLQWKHFRIALTRRRCKKKHFVYNSKYLLLQKILNEIHYQKSTAMFFLSWRFQLVS